MVDDSFCKVRDGKLEGSSQKIKMQRIYPHTVWIILGCCLSIIITYFVFRICIDQKSRLADRISVGAIFATFGSALATIFLTSLQKYYERIKENDRVFVEELVAPWKWKRWSFVKRQAHKVLFDEESSYYEQLTQAEIVFNTGAYELAVPFPTVLEDFFDLPIWKKWRQMNSRRKDYEKMVIHNCKGDVGSTLTAWDCIYDSYRTILKYRIIHVLLYASCSLIVSSLVFSFVVRRFF